jgi:hypothetical protein|tara:strand:- start:653 stop:979 length:327 start_codon:yes stop_codon:yes gene_type:complete
MASYFNITGATSAAAELTRELLAPGDNSKASKISLSNIHASGTKCTVDLYIEKKLTGKFYLLKSVELPGGTTLLHDLTGFSNRADEFGLYLKLTKSASETPSVDVILY